MILLASLVFAVAAPAAADCNAPTPAPVVHLELPGNPFAPLPSSDGCWVFVTMPAARDGAPGGIAVLRRGDGNLKLERVIPIRGNPTGAVLTHDGRMLIATAGLRVAFLDVQRMINGAANPVLGMLGGEVPGAGRVYVNVTRDDRWVFVSDEGAQTISVIDLDKARRTRFGTTAIVGKIPTGRAPIALTFSPDERYLYTTTQVAPAHLSWPTDCRPQGSDPANPPPFDHTHGAIVVVDVERAKTAPASSIVAVVSAGCNPVRLVLSPAGEVAYVSARTDNALLAFDTGRLRAQAADALIGSVPVGTAPVGVAVIDDGRKVVVTNSNRFGGSANDQQYLTVIDAARMRDGRAAVLGTIPAGAFPREMRITADGRTLLLTNFASQTLQVIDLARLALEPTR